jgi:hypothetical protein
VAIGMLRPGRATSVLAEMFRSLRSMIDLS